MVDTEPLIVIFRAFQLLPHRRPWGAGRRTLIQLVLIAAIISFLAIFILYSYNQTSANDNIKTYTTIIAFMGVATSAVVAILQFFANRNAIYTVWLELQSMENEFVESLPQTPSLLFWVFLVENFVVFESLLMTWFLYGAHRAIFGIPYHLMNQYFLLLDLYFSLEVRSVGRCAALTHMALIGVYGVPNVEVLQTVRDLRERHHRLLGLRRTIQQLFQVPIYLKSKTILFYTFIS